MFIFLWMVKKMITSVLAIIGAPFLLLAIDDETGLLAYVFDGDENVYWREVYYGNPMTRHDICPTCDAELLIQSGFDEEELYWTCKECGEYLTNPIVRIYVDCEEWEVIGNVNSVCNH